MAEKIKAFGEAAKNIVLFVLGPILAIVAYILYLMNEQERLKEALRTERFNGDQKLKIKEQEHADSVAADSRERYEQLKQDYLRGDQD